MSTTIGSTSLDDAAERLGLIGLETAVLGVVAAPELDVRFARLRPSPRVIATLLGPHAIAALAPLVACGAVRFGEGPVAIDRPLRLAPRLAAFLLRAPLPVAPLRRVDAPAVDPGREDEVRGWPSWRRCAGGCRSWSSARTRRRCSPAR